MLIIQEQEKGSNKPRSKIVEASLMEIVRFWCVSQQGGHDVGNSQQGSTSAVRVLCVVSCASAGFVRLLNLCHGGPEGIVRPFRR